MESITQEPPVEAQSARASEDRRIVLPDGRQLGFAEYGDPSGMPVMAFHGTPGSRFMFRPVDAPALRLGLRIIAPDRPGFGLSSFQKNRTLRDWPNDVAALADRLGVGRFAIVGISGGGPYTAACAALLPKRVTAAALISPMGPVHAPYGPDDLPAAQIATFKLLPHLTPAMRSAFAMGRLMFLHAPDIMYRAVKRRAGPADSPILSRPEIEKNLVAGVIEGVRTSGRGVAHEFKIFGSPWNIPLEAITCPMLLWQGLADNNVPVAASLRLAEIVPGCRLTRIEGAGHYWIFDHVEEVLTDLKEEMAAAPDL